MLTKVEELEFKSGKIDKIKEEIKETEEVINKKKEDLETLIKERKDSINKFTKEKEKLTEKLPAPTVNIFDRIYRNKSRFAIVAIENQVCQGCFIKVPLQAEISVKKNDQLIYCPSCSRVLYRAEEKQAKSA